MLSERKKLVGFKKGISRNGTSFCAMHFLENIPDVQGHAASTATIFIDEVIENVNEKWLGKEVELGYSVNYAKNSIFLIDVKLIS